MLSHVLSRMSGIKNQQIGEYENEIEDINRNHTILKQFEAYCTELRLKASASDICSCVDELIARANELEEDHEAFIGRPDYTPTLSFKATDLGELAHVWSSNIIGRIEENPVKVENFVLIAGLHDGQNLTKDVAYINLHNPQDTGALQQIPTTMQNGAAAAAYRNAMYVTGIGDKYEEIWTYNLDSGWMKCASLVQSRSRHSSAFLDEVLYICGGYVESDRSVLDSVEAYSASSNICTSVGKLVHSVQSLGNCVPFKSSLYIFGGTDKSNNALNQVQVYDTKQNTCTLLSRPMPRGYSSMQAAVWDTSVVLLGCYACFIFNFETETWQERNQFKTDVIHFGLVFENGRIFVIGGGMSSRNETGTLTWTCRDDVRYVPLKSIIDDKLIEWKSYAKLEKPVLVQTYGKLAFWDDYSNI